MMLVMPAMRPLLLVATLVMVAACEPSSPATTEPSGGAASLGPPVLGIDWGRATLERPDNFTETLPPSFDNDHPILRFPGQATMSDVIGLAGGSLVAIGYAPPDWLPYAWTSSDGSSWTIHSIDTSTFTFPSSLAQGVDGVVVAVGRSGAMPMAWTTNDGVRWAAHGIPTLDTDGTAERMTAVVAGPNGFVAGGSVGPEALDRRARFWTSPDGVAWTPVPDDTQAFANAEVRAIETVREGFVAVGVVGTAQSIRAAVAWISPDGVSWTRVDDPAFDEGVAVSVVEAPWGGLLAVGSDVAKRNAVAWTSPDGRDWTRAPDEPSRQRVGGFAFMTDVVTIGDVAVGIGTTQINQRGAAASWVSSDGTTWQRAIRAPVLEQGEFYAIARGGPGVVAVGSFGAPDSYVATIWLSPAR